MGSSSSKSKIEQEINQNFVTLNTFNAITHDIVNYSINQIINVAQTCGGVMTYDQLANFANTKIGNNFKFYGNFRQASYINLKCVQQSDINQNVNVDIAKQIISMFQTDVNTNILQNLENAAKTNSQSGFLATGSSTSISEIRGKYNLNVTNSNTYNIENVVITNIDMNMSTSVIQNCIISVSATQQLNFINATIGDNAVIFFDSQQISQALLDCMSSSKIVSNTVSKILDNLGLQIHQSTDTTSELVNKSTTEAAAKTSGFDDLMAVITGPLFWSSCCFFVFIIIMGILFIKLINSEGGREAMQLAATRGKGSSKPVYKPPSYPPYRPSPKPLPALPSPPAYTLS
jgi:hypothetical protein